MTGATIAGVMGVCDIEADFSEHLRIQPQAKEAAEKRRITIVSRRQTLMGLG
jgi:hypothetical protein